MADLGSPEASRVVVRGLAALDHQEDGVCPSPDDRLCLAQQPWWDGGAASARQHASTPARQQQHWRELACTRYACVRVWRCVGMLDDASTVHGGNVHRWWQCAQTCSTGQDHPRLPHSQTLLRQVPLALDRLPQQHWQRLSLCTSPTRYQCQCQHMHAQSVTRDGGNTSVFGSR